MPPGKMPATKSKFLSTPSARRATCQRHQYQSEQQCISIHALREEGDLDAEKTGVVVTISIHALREEGDATEGGGIYVAVKISIHALREEGDHFNRPHPVPVYVFLSTPSARRATSALIPSGAPLLDFYPRPPRGGRHVAVHRGNAVGVISIHALREEGDPVSLICPVMLKRFLSTPSARRATVLILLMLKPLLNFYPRPPRGGRPPQCGSGCKR